MIVCANPYSTKRIVCHSRQHQTHCVPLQTAPNTVCATLDSTKHTLCHSSQHQTHCVPLQSAPNTVCAIPDCTKHTVCHSSQHQTHCVPLQSTPNTVCATPDSTKVPLKLAAQLIQLVSNVARRSLFDYPYKISNTRGRKEQGVVPSKCSEMDNAMQQSQGDRSSLTNRSKNFGIGVGSTGL